MGEQTLPDREVLVLKTDGKRGGRFRFGSRWVRRGILAGICLIGIVWVIFSERGDKHWLAGSILTVGLLIETGFSLHSLNQQLKKKDSQLTALSAISRAVQNSSQLDEILATIQVQVRKDLGVDNFYVALYDEANRHIWYPMAVKGGEVVYWTVRPLSDRLTDRVILNQRSIILPSHAHEELQRIGLPLGDKPLTAWMGVPLIISHRMIGCLAVFSYSPYTVFTENDLRLLEALAGQVSIAVENMFLNQQVQQRAEQIERMNLMNRQRELLTETLVHDLRSPLGTVLSALEVIHETAQPERGESAQTIRRAVQVARQGAQRVLSLVEAVLEIARLEEGGAELQMEMFDPAEMLIALVNEYQPRCVENRLGIELQLARGIPMIEGDREKLRRVLENLIDNAIKFTPAGGEIRLIAGTQAEGTVQIQVEDSGPGIPEEYRERVFERFYQVPGVESRRRGSGLGLTFSKLVVQAHGGDIWIDSAAEGGCRVILRLPVERAKP